MSTSDEALFSGMLYAPKCINIATFFFLLQNLCVNFGVLLEKEMCAPVWFYVLKLSEGVERFLAISSFTDLHGAIFVVD